MTLPRQPRADARRNRAKVLAAAEKVFADRGTTAPTEEVARAAGVGVGTVFRHFPTKDALLQALIENRLARIAADAREHAASPDPGAAFFEFFAAAVRGSASKLELVDALAELGVHPNEAVAPVAAEMTQALDVLLRNAQRARAVRVDIEVGDVIALLGAASQANRSAPADRPLATILDGLRFRASE